VYNTEKLIREQGESLSDEEKAPVEEALAELKTAIGEDDFEAMKDKTDTLMAATQVISTKLYEQAAAEADSGEGEAANAPDDDEVVDAEIIEEDDEDSE
jgi:molecular chaperone DnaK